MTWTNEDGKTVLIDEVLCYVQNKMKILEVDPIVSLCDPVFDATQIEQSKKKLFELCHKENDKTGYMTHNGPHKNDKNIRDIYDLLHEKGEDTPLFVSQDLNKLPPVTVKHLDMSLVLTENKELRAEVLLMKQAMDMQKRTNDDLVQIMKQMCARLDKLEGRASGMPGLNVSIDQQLRHTEIENNSTINDDFLRPTTLRDTPPVELNATAMPFDNANANGATSYANMVNQSKSHGNGYVLDEDGYFVVGPNGKALRTAKPVNRFPHVQNVKKNSVSVIGKSTRNSLSAAPRVVKANVFATRFPPTTNPEEVKEYLKEDERLKDLDIIVDKVTPKYDTYASFHITCVCLEPKSKVFLEPDIWPDGILLRPWKEKRTNRNQGNNVQLGHNPLSSRWVF